MLLEGIQANRVLVQVGSSRESMRVKTWLSRSDSELKAGGYLVLVGVVFGGNELACAGASFLLGSLYIVRTFLVFLDSNERHELGRTAAIIPPTTDPCLFPLPPIR